jgi:homoserine kinase type II
MISCLGVEDPESLKGPLVFGLIKGAKKMDLFSDISWTYLVDYILAIRFAWLSEWLRKKDNEMLELELDYMSLLFDNLDNIKSLWQI